MKIISPATFWRRHCWWFRNPASTSVDMVNICKYPIIYRVFYTSNRWLALGFFSSTSSYYVTSPLAGKKPSIQVSKLTINIWKTNNFGVKNFRHHLGTETFFFHISSFFLVPLVLGGLYRSSTNNAATGFAGHEASWSLVLEWRVGSKISRHPLHRNVS